MLAPRPVLVAPDSFKGTFRAAEVAGAIGRGLERAGLMPPDLCPVADGGEGTLDALLPGSAASSSRADAHDPLGREVTGRLRRCSRTAARRSSRSPRPSGLALVAEDERDAWAASTYGTGELIAAAVDAGRRGRARRRRRLGDHGRRRRRARGDRGAPAGCAARGSSSCATCARRSRRAARCSARRRAPTRPWSTRLERAPATTLAAGAARATRAACR